MAEAGNSNIQKDDQLKYLLDKMEYYSFMIEDPFDKTYCPSRQIEMNTGAFKKY